ncbi:MAG: DUF2007 domain-containing protein [Gammaproteobacteria bacterium]|nr:DUF2007 domain-containing protein [Gammaproteobacteria bacterium]
MVLIYRAQDIIEAHIVAGLLNAEGIESHVSGHYLQGGIGEISVAGFANVHVPDDELEKAQQVIANYEQNLNKAEVKTAAEVTVVTAKWLRYLAAILFVIIVSFLLAL